MIAKWSRLIRILLGVSSLVPLCALSVMVIFIGTATNQALDGSLQLARRMTVVLTPAFLGYMFGYILVLLFCIDTWKNPVVRPERKGIWIFLLVVLAPFALPAYWYTYVWRSGQFDSRLGRQS